MTILRVALPVATALLGCAAATVDREGASVDVAGSVQASSTVVSAPPITFDYTPDKVGDRCRESSESSTSRQVGREPPATVESKQADSYEVLEVAKDASVKERLRWTKHETLRNGVKDEVPITLGRDFLMGLGPNGEELVSDAEGEALPENMAAWIAEHWRVGHRDSVALGLHGAALRPGDAAPGLASTYRRKVPAGAVIRAERFVFVERDDLGAKFAIEIDASFRWENPGDATIRATLWVAVPRGTPRREELAWSVRRKFNGEDLRFDGRSLALDECDGGR
jgi:hypothetical protein